MSPSVRARIVPVSSATPEAIFAARLSGIHSARYRQRRVVAPDRQRPVCVQVDGQPCLSFCSNDYLGLAGHPEVVAALVAAAQRYGVGSGASHLVAGHGPEHEALEAELAAFTRRPRALVFSTGYMANLGVGSALFQPGDRVFEDRFNHASLLDAGMASGVRFSRYPHANVEALERRLQRQADTQDGRSWILTDGVFSMDGNVAPLPALASVARRYTACLIVDDAHGFGVLGHEGGGSTAAAGLDTDDVPVLMGTLGKAFGTFGAFVAGSANLIELLIQRARTYIYTTALPPPIAAATRTALRIACTESWRRERLARHVARFRSEAAALGWPLLPATTPIQPLVLGSENAALQASAALAAAGFLVTAIRPPTVPEGSARLRITFSAAHEDDDVERLLAALRKLPLRGGQAA